MHELNLQVIDQRIHRSGPVVDRSRALQPLLDNAHQCRKVAWNGMLCKIFNDLVPSLDLRVCNIARSDTFTLIDPWTGQTTHQHTLRMHQVLHDSDARGTAKQKQNLEIWRSGDRTREKSGAYAGGEQRSRRPASCCKRGKKRAPYVVAQDKASAVS